MPHQEKTLARIGGRGVSRRGAHTKRKGDQSVLPIPRNHSGTRRRRGREGFTLVEVLVAFAVLGVATWIILSLFTSSLQLEKNARSMRVAADLARDRLADITARPGAYTWPAADTISAETGAPLTLKDASGTAGFATPAALPTSPLAARSEAAFYDKFAWEAFVKQPAAGRGCYELLVVVRWQEANRPQQVVLSGSIPVAMTKEAS